MLKDKTAKRWGIIGIVAILLICNISIAKNFEQKVGVKTLFASARNVGIDDNINDIIIVDNEGDGEFTSIQEAINHSKDGDVIEVYSGIYNENIRIDKQISLIGVPYEFKNGNDTGMPVMHGLGELSEHVVEISADSCMIKGFLIENGNAGVAIYGGYAILSNNYIHNNTEGIFVSREGSIIEKNIIINNEVGIHVEYAHNLYIEGNFIERSNCGMRVDFARGSVLRNNSLNNCGIYVKGNTLLDYYIDIDTSNTINGKPIYYLINETGTNIKSNAGQIFLINCSFCNISSCHIEHGYIGIFLAYSHHNIVNGNTITNQSWNGIHLEHSNDNTIENNIICRNDRNGICLYHSSYNIVKHNNINQNGHDGIHIDSNNTYVSYNKIANNSGFGIFLTGCSSNIVTKNMMKDNGDGIGLYCCTFNEISWNDIRENVGYCIEMENSICNKVHHNNLIKRGYHAMLINSFFNLWYRNYWSNWHLPLLKPIIGITILFPGALPIVWLTFDIFPKIVPFK